LRADIDAVNERVYPSRIVPLGPMIDWSEPARRA
jgi:hypothetical protein